MSQPIAEQTQPWQWTCNVAGYSNETERQLKETVACVIGLTSQAYPNPNPNPIDSSGCP